MASEVETTDAALPLRRLGGRGFLRASVAGPKAGVAEEARTRGFASPGFPGCAFSWQNVATGGLPYGEVHIPSRSLLGPEVCEVSERRT